MRIREQPPRTLTIPVAELDLVTAPKFDRLRSRVQIHAHHVVVDVCALGFIDATGLRSLQAGQLRASRWQRRLTVICAPGQTQRLLALSGLDQLLHIIEPATPMSVPPAPLNEHTVSPSLSDCCDRS